MSDRNGSGDGLGRIETLLTQLEVGDLHLPSPPPEVWAAVEQAFDADRRDSSESVRPWRARRWMVAAAAASVALAVVASAVIRTDDAAEEVVSTAVLVHDPAAFDPRGVEASATAELVELEGSYAIRLSGQGLSVPPGGDLELWLIEPDASGRPLDVAPVGVLRGDGAGVYVVPETVDPRSHYVVDISIEPRDGDPAHSGHSILRGALEPG